MTNGEVRLKKEREFHLSDADFKRIQMLVAHHTGINLSDAKRDMVYSRLSRRLRNLEIETFEEYCDLLESSPEDELVNFTNAITTNLTSFFREMHHFEYLSKKVLPEVIRTNAHTKKIRIWSAGCSTGEEPYSIAITVKETLNNMHGWDVKILATDLDSNVLQTAQNAIYSVDRVKDLPANRLKRWFRKGRGDLSNSVCVADDARELITFKQLNLMHEWPMRGPFDLIFCRNVVIYFDKPTQKILFDRYADILVNHGHLFIGHSESLYRVSDRFNLIGNTIYQKKD